jgi:amino-acid N-acetyltransferase
VTGSAGQQAVVYRPAFGQRKAARPSRPRLTMLRPAAAADIAAIHALIADHAGEGRLLPRSVTDIAAHIDGFIVATQHNEVVGCVDLAALSSEVAEVRSLVVAPEARDHGVGSRLLRELTTRAALAQYDTLCAFTHSPAYFVQMGFAIVPHAWLPEKIDRDCRGCAEFRRCGQYAVAMPLDAAAVRLRGAVNG